jgi:hypothetical protein
MTGSASFFSRNIRQVDLRIVSLSDPNSKVAWPQTEIWLVLLRNRPARSRSAWTRRTSACRTRSWSGRPPPPWTTRQGVDRMNFGRNFRSRYFFFCGNFSNFSFIRMYFGRKYQKGNFMKQFRPGIFGRTVMRFSPGVFYEFSISAEKCSINFFCTEVWRKKIFNQKLCTDKRSILQLRTTLSD